jgi:hypothetical protein
MRRRQDYDETTTRRDDNETMTRRRDDDEECEALKTMREADAVEKSKVAVLNSIDNNTGASGMENNMIDGESGAIVVNRSRRKI